MIYSAGGFYVVALAHLSFEIFIKWLFKGIVHPEMKIHSLCTHHYADGGVGEVQKTLLESQM